MVNIVTKVFKFAKVSLSIYFLTHVVESVHYA